MPRFAPCLFERRILPKPWGGRALERTLGLTLPAGELVGETWELFDRADGSSRLRGSDRTLADLMRDDATALLGAGVAPGFGGRFPLLVKYIDAADRLSVQVHPGEAQAHAVGDGAKTEAWVVLDAGPKARIVCGLRPGVTPEAFARVAATPAVEDLLHAFTPNPGDVVYVPHGTVHAIGPDVVVLEIQQNSDITYRLYDWGRPRDTHLAEGLQALRPNAPSTVTTTPAPDGALLHTDAFTIRRLEFARPTTVQTNATCAIANVIAGNATLTWNSGTLPLIRADTLLIPACIPEVTFTPAGSLTLIWSSPGPKAFG